MVNLLPGCGYYIYIVSSNLLFFRSPGRISEVSRRNLNSRLFSIFLVVLGHLHLGATQWPQTQCVQIYPPPQFSRGCQWPHCFNLTSQLVFLFPPLPPAVHVHIQAEPLFKHICQLTPLPRCSPMASHLTMPWPARLFHWYPLISLTSPNICLSLISSTQACLSLEHTKLAANGLTLFLH